MSTPPLVQTTSIVQFHNSGMKQPVRMNSSLPLLFSVWLFTAPLLTQALEETEPCPDRAPGMERRGSCSKACREDRNCPGKRKCLCDGECGFSCVIPGRSCPWPLAHGANTVSRLLSPTPSFSMLLETRCQPGFTMPGSLRVVVRRCQGDRQWSGQDPTCTPVRTNPHLSCPLPDESESGFTLEGSSAVGSTVLYHCRPGFKLVGNKENFCEENQTWQYPHPVCQRMFCSPPAKVNKGYLVAVQRQAYEVDEAIYYLCKKTFVLDGPNRVICQADGTWSKVPFCRARCTVPAQRSRVIIGEKKLWPSEVPDGVVEHMQNVTFYCKNPEKHCSFTSTQTCFDGELVAPDCYIEPTWLQYKLFPHRLVSEIHLCGQSDL